MGRGKGKKKKVGVVCRHEKARAWRHISVGSSETGYEKVKQFMECGFGLTDAEGIKHKFHATGEADGLYITITGDKKDVVNMMFEAAIGRVGFELE